MGTRIVWGYPTEDDERLADEGQVILGGCVVETGVAPSHECGACGSEFIASNMLYRRTFSDGEVFGVGVWPHGRSRVRIEETGDGWLAAVERKGSMLLGEHDFATAMNDVFADWWPWEVQDWASRRGFPAEVEPTETGWSLVVREGGPFVELLLLKTWWRSLGRSPIDKAIERLSCEVSSPIWMSDVGS